LRREHNRASECDDNLAIIVEIFEPAIIASIDIPCEPIGRHCQKEVSYIMITGKSNMVNKGLISIIALSVSHCRHKIAPRPPVPLLISAPLDS
jgi:hypothetical protein